MSTPTATRRPQPAVGGPRWGAMQGPVSKADDFGTSACGLDLFGDFLELDLRPGRNDHVCTGFRECQRHCCAQPAARSGHHRDLAVQPKPVKNHLCLPSLAGEP